MSRLFLVGVCCVLAMGTASGCGDDDDRRGGGTDTDGGTTGGTDGGSTGGTDGGGMTGGEVQICQEECVDDDDCMVDGSDIGATCDGSRCAFGATGAMCSNDVECQIGGPAVVDVYTDCTSGGGECDALGQVCVDVGGMGKCVPPAPGGACAAPTQDPVTVSDIDGEDVTVCGDPNAECNDDGACESPCQNDDDCAAFAAVGQPSCDTETGQCVCTADADCEGADNAAGTTCYTDRGSCGCTDDTECADVPSGNSCNDDGICTCGDVAECTGDMTFDGTMFVCE